jgi:hypothetical protein
VLRISSTAVAKLAKDELVVLTLGIVCHVPNLARQVWSGHKHCDYRRVA